MKTTKILLTGILALAIATPAINAQQRQMPREYGGGEPGIVVSSSSSSISDLPQPALKFLSHHYKGVNVSKVEREYLPNTFDVKLADGTEVEFNADGKVIEIDAPDGTALKPGLVRDLVGRKMYDNLKHNGQANSVESIDFTYQNGKLIKVETASVASQELIFDLNGNLVIVNVDD